MASPKNLTGGQIINQPRRAEVALANGKKVKQVCRELGVSEQTYYRWRKEYGGRKVRQAKRLKELEIFVLSGGGEGTNRAVAARIQHRPTAQLSGLSTSSPGSHPAQSEAAQPALATRTSPQAK